MSWFKKLFAGPKRIEDPIFGSLLYMGDYWEGSGVLTPDGPIVEWFVSAGEAGPNQLQYETLQSIRSHLPSIMASLRAAISKSAASFEGLEIPSPQSFEVSALEVPASLSDSTRWDIYFSAREPSTVSAVVTLSGWQPTDVEFSP